MLKSRETQKPSGVRNQELGRAVPADRVSGGSAQTRGETISEDLFSSNFEVSGPGKEAEEVPIMHYAKALIHAAANDAGMIEKKSPCSQRRGSLLANVDRPW